eukprot:171307_1
MKIRSKCERNDHRVSTTRLNSNVRKTPVIHHATRIVERTFIQLVDTLHPFGSLFIIFTFLNLILAASGQSPSAAPSHAPSDAPSDAPTNNPIASADFDFFVDIVYVLRPIKTDDIKKITWDPLNVTLDIENVMKNEYAFNEDLMSYKDFLIDIQRIQDIQIAKIDALTMIEWVNVQSLELQTVIECNEYACCSIKEQSKEENDFAPSVSRTLQTYFGNHDLQFSVKGGANTIEIVSKNAANDTTTSIPSAIFLTTILTHLTFLYLEFW